MSPELTVVAPVFDEAETIDEFHRRLTAALDAGSGVEADRCEVIYVDDGSTDGSGAALARLARLDTRVSVVTFSRNFGHQVAITAGLDRARGDAVVIIDSDLQDPPELIGELVAQWRLGAQVVHAVRDERQGESRFKLATAKWFYRGIRRLTDLDIQLDAGDFRLIDRSVVDVLTSMRERHRFVRGMVAWAGFRQVGVAYDRSARYAGHTKYPMRRMLRLAVNAVTSFSFVPLQLATLVGFVVATLALLAVPVVVVARALGSPFLSGQTTVLLVALGLGGLQMMFLGVIGEYVGRIVEEVKARPLYVVVPDDDPTTAPDPAP
ncbi:MAG: glycosyltransferase family 2 protein [Microthrixaceae bacterium]